MDRGIAAASGLCRSEEVRALVLVPSTSSDSVLPWCLFWLGLSNYFCAFFGGAFLVGITRGLLLEAEESTSGFRWKSSGFFGEEMGFSWVRELG